MRDLHAWNGILVIAADALAAGWGLSYVLRKRVPGPVYAHLLAAAQAIVIAQVGLGLLLLSGDERATDQLHYLYGFLSLGVILSPWIYAPPVPAKRLAWFSGACFVAGALAVRAYTTSG